MQLPAQTVIGEYQIERHLARGGMADVYLAHHATTGETVAIKMVSKSQEDYCLRFHREIDALSKLSHEHILPVIDYGEYQEWCYLITPYISYGTLSKHLAKNGPLSPQEAGKILQQLTSALHEAHTHGIVHRDIKPSNILMKDGTHAYIADFGVLKSNDEPEHLTLTGCLIGTPEYMAPELADKKATPQSDIYALGVVLYQMLTGQMPFKGSTPLGVYLKHVRETPPPPSSINGAIPRDIEAVILQALDKQPSLRYQTALELNDAYQQALNQAEKRNLALTDQETQANALIIPDIQNQEKNSLPLPASRKYRATNFVVWLFLLLIVGSAMVHFIFANAYSSSSHAAANAPIIHTTPKTHQKVSPQLSNGSDLELPSLQYTSTENASNPRSSNPTHHTKKKTPSSTPTPVATSTPPVTPVPTPEPSPTVAPTPEPSPTVEPTPEPSPTVAPTPEPSPTVEPTPESSPTVAPTPELTPSAQTSTAP